MVVFPALSNPRMRILTCFEENNDEKTLDISIPIMTPPSLFYLKKRNCFNFFFLFQTFKRQDVKIKRSSLLIINNEMYGNDTVYYGKKCWPNNRKYINPTYPSLPSYIHTRLPRVDQTSHLTSFGLRLCGSVNTQQSIVRVNK